MNKSDFDEYEGLQLLISKAARQYKRSTERWVEIVTFWQDVAPKHFGEELAFEIVQGGSRVDGITVGQRFAIRSTIAVKDGGASLRATLIIREPLNDTEIELDSFLVQDNGTIASLDGEVLLDREDDLREYKLLSAIVRRVFGVTKN